MKDARTYEKKIRKLLAGMKKVKPAENQADPLELVVVASLEENASAARAKKAMTIFEKEFVDLNELRAAQPRELVELMDRNYPDARRTAEQITAVLNAVFYYANDLSMEELAEKPKRDLRKQLLEFGMSHYVSAVLMMHFGGHAVPVDLDLVETLIMDEYLPEDCSLEDAQGFLERVIAHRDGLSAHQFFRAYVDKRSDALAKKRKADEAARIAAEKKAAEEQAAKQRAEEEKKAAKAKKAKEAAAKKAERKKAKTRTAGKTKTARKPLAKKRARKKTAKRPAKPAAKKK